MKIIIDCDGVLTDGKIYYTSLGQRSKGFNSRDIWAIRELISRGYQVQIMTASSWPGIKEFAKRTGAEVLVTREKFLDPPYIAIGDDVWDIDLLKGADMAFAPANCIPFIKKMANVRKLKSRGGEGVIAELLEHL